MIAALHVQQGGLHTTVQDLGRYGWQSMGVPVSGALDATALRVAEAYQRETGWEKRRPVVQV